MAFCLGIEGCWWKSDTGTKSFATLDLACVKT